MEPQEKARYTLSGKRIFQGYSLIAECPTSQSAADLFDRLNESTRLQARVEQLERERESLMKISGEARVALRIIHHKCEAAGFAFPLLPELRKIASDALGPDTPETEKKA